MQYTYAIPGGFIGYRGGIHARRTGTCSAPPRLRTGEPPKDGAPPGRRAPTMPLARETS